MDVMEAIFTRRSIRKYKRGQITKEQLMTIIKAGCYAPSAHNRQPWHFVVIRDRERLKAIAGFHSYARMLHDADTCIVVCGDKERQPQTGFLIEDCSAAIQNMLLAIHAMGLGAVWCGLYPVVHLTRGMKQLLSLPDRIIPVGLISIGYKGEERTVADRFDENKIHYEEWGSKKAMESGTFQA